MVTNEVFATYITDKILRCQAIAEEDKSACISLLAVRGESEAGQIMISASTDIKEVSVEIFDLIADGGEIFSSSNIKVFYQKYIEVTRISDGERDGKLGWFPDMLLPYDKAVEVRENCIAKGDNQAIILDFKVGREVRPGEYKGKCIIRLDGEVHEMPIKLEIADITISETPKMDSLFCMTYEFIERAEKDKSVAVKKAYYDTLLEYKAVARDFPLEKENEENFCKDLREYYHKIPGYSIPMDECEYWGAPRYMNYDLLKRMVLAVAKISLEDDINYLDKVRNYYLTVDEPEHNDIEDAASATCFKFKKILQEAAEEVEKFDCVDGKKITKKLLAETIRNNIYGLMTAGYTERIKGVDIWCPGYRQFTTEAARKTYREYGKPYWGYTCNSPNHPFPNYHIDDMNSFLSSRVIGWIMQQYGVTGNLYYETVFFEKVSYKDGLHLEPTDPYTDPMKYPGTNGDGYLFYPGIKYGIKGPISSNRLIHIRDAEEDYELLGILKCLYSESKKDDYKLFNRLYAKIHSLTAVTITGKEFFKIRELLIGLILKAKAGIFYNSLEEYDNFEVNNG